MELKYLKDVATLKLNSEKCTGCRMCAVVCPHRVFKIENRKAVITDKNRCMECGACMINCKDQAIEVDTGVGCAYAVIKGKLTGTEPDCGCSDTGGC